LHVKLASGNLRIGISYKTRRRLVDLDKWRKILHTFLSVDVLQSIDYRSDFWEDERATPRVQGERGEKKASKQTPHPWGA